VSRAHVRAEFARRLPFAAEIIICRGSEIVSLMSCDFFAGHAPRPDIVRFVSVLAQLPGTTPPTPMNLPSRGKWLVRVLARERRFVVGLYRGTPGATGRHDRGRPRAAAGGGASKRSRMMLNMLVAAPTPMAIVTTTTAARPGARRSMRTA